MKKNLLFCLGIVLLLTLSTFENLKGSEPGKAGSFDWPRFRGPNSDGISPETNLLKSWPEGGPKELWRVPIGVGYSGIAVSGDQVYTMDSQKDSEFLVCLDAANGGELWRTKVAALYKDGQGDGPRSFPTLDGEVVYALSGNGNLLAANAKTGKALWKLDVKNKFNFRDPPDWWGFSMSPLIEGNTLLLQAGGSGDR